MFVTLAVEKTTNKISINKLRSHKRAELYM